MARYNEKNYSLSYALENIGELFWKIYKNDLFEYAKDRSKKDILEHIHQEWESTTHNSPTGTDIRIEWAVAIYDHGDWDKAQNVQVPNHNDTASKVSDIDPRRKYPADFRCDNGVYVRSLSELCIANWLYANNIAFDYERIVVFGKTTAHCDFYLPIQDMYIEFWGMTNDEQYKQYRQWKEPLYKKHGYKLVSLELNDLKNLRDQLNHYGIVTPKI